MKNHAYITLNGLELSVNLGWPQGERIKQQMITADVTLFFAAPPTACVTDQLADTYCYDKLVASIKTNLATRHFRLLEHLGHEIYQLIKQQITSDVRVQVHLTKKPAILHLTGGVTFCYGDK
ncbi:MAG: dihydroneopterin aldolase [uncultured bacterium]|nr:MAG: dihydroneopterin aldolase [uncultured bacterium]